MYYVQKIRGVCRSIFKIRHKCQTDYADIDYPAEINATKGNSMAIDLKSFMFSSIAINPVDCGHNYVPCTGG